MLITFDNRLERNFIMTIELIKQLLDACYLAKRAREMLPALPEGVTSSYIRVSGCYSEIADPWHPAEDL